MWKINPPLTASSVVDCNEKKNPTHNWIEPFSWFMISWSKSTFFPCLFRQFSSWKIRIIFAWFMSAKLCKMSGKLTFSSSSRSNHWGSQHSWGTSRCVPRHFWWIRWRCRSTVSIGRSPSDHWRPRKRTCERNCWKHWKRLAESSRPSVWSTFLLQTEINYNYSN